MSYTEPLKRGVLYLEKGLNAVFSQQYNPFYYHGALPNFFIWVLYGTGLLLFAYYVPTLAQAYDSVRYITHGLPFGNAYRTLHRYAADGMMIFVMLHLLRVWFTDRYREYRIVPWITGVVLLTITFIIGITGYMLIWDQEAVTLTQVTVGFIQDLPLVGAGLANFVMAGELITDYTLTRILFFHLAIPLLLMFFLWFHYLRITRPVNIPPWPLIALMFGGLFLVSSAFPVELGARPVLAEISNHLELDLFYAWPQWLLTQGVSPATIWILLLGVPVGLLVLPYLQKKALRGQYAQVLADNCTGCSLCYHDCPYEAILMVDRDDDSRFKRLATVDPGRCSNCGLCVGACAFKAIEVPRCETPDVLGEIEAALSTSS